MISSGLRLLLLALLLAALASAGPLTWTVFNAAFDDGGTIAGSFVYNADTNVFSSIALSSTPGAVRSGADYTQVNPCCVPFVPFAGFLLFITEAPGDLTGTPSFAAVLEAPMTNSGGAIPFDLGGSFYEEESCVDDICSGGTSPVRFLASGGVTAVPEPGTFLLLAPAAAFVIRRRR